MPHKLTEPQNRLLRQLRKAGEHGVDPLEHYTTTVEALVREGHARIGLVTVTLPRVFLAES